MAPAKPMQLVWAAVNRVTAEGPVAGPRHKVSLDVALKAITIDAAYSIRMEKRLGSIEVGKDANLTVLDRSPHAVAPEQLKDITVWGTMLEGRVQPVPRQHAEVAAQRSAQAPQVTAPVAAISQNTTEVGRAIASKLTKLLAHQHND